jgi:hypothetical protein
MTILQRLFPSWFTADDRVSPQRVLQMKVAERVEYHGPSWHWPPRQTAKILHMPTAKAMRH